MVEYAGWQMPLMYRSILDEHEQTRKSGSIFDVSHMGRIQFKGPDALKFLEHVVTRKLSDATVGQSRYGLVCNAQGGTMDDVIVSRDQKHWLMVCNASNRDKLVKHFNEVRRAMNADFDLADQTEATTMVAIQGPKVVARIGEALNIDIASMKRYRFVNESFMLVKFMIFRSGYTGEDGIEMILPSKMAGMAMKLLAGKVDKPDATIKPAGLGARDTLRLEAGMPLYGHELSETIDPISAGLGWACDLTKEFIGVEPLRKIHAEGPKRKLVGLELAGKRIARQGAAVLKDGAPIGEITSGTFGPTVRKSIAMGFIDSALTAEGTTLKVDFKSEQIDATIVKMPFYKRV